MEPVGSVEGGVLRSSARSGGRGIPGEWPRLLRLLLNGYIKCIS